LALLHPNTPMMTKKILSERGVSWHHVAELSGHMMPL